jgi:hypothetical protein
VRDRTHWNSPNLRPRDPVLLGLCSQNDLNNAVLRARKAQEKATAARNPATPPPPAPEPAKPALPGGLDISAFMPKQAPK